MCGILGFAPSLDHRTLLNELEASSERLALRGPDAKGLWLSDDLGLAHRRLSIIDTSTSANQPMWDIHSRYGLVFNGEIYNYKELRAGLTLRGCVFQTASDTEVLLQLYMLDGEQMLDQLNGFFAFAIYDRESKELFLARDRMGIKPLVYSMNEFGFSFSSEVKALISFLPKKEVSQTALFSYLQLTYVPAPLTMIQGVFKLEPGHCMRVQCGKNPKFLNEPTAYYQLESGNKGISSVNTKDYLTAMSEMKALLRSSVQKRLVADVPLGAFLSGGVDSSIIALLASQDQKDFQTFSIGYADEVLFDESAYALEVADSIGTEHTVFDLKNEDLFEHYQAVLDYMDEPFADSSALAVYILSQKTRKHVSVALSGDGADELFSGYNKHAAEFRIDHPPLIDGALPLVKPLLNLFPKSRQSKLGNLNRKAERYLRGKNLSRRDRYWAWASILDEEDANYLLREKQSGQLQRLSDEAYGYKKLRERYLNTLSKGGDFNEVLLCDQRLVLSNDMLKKVDSMSMANSLEVRTPFLDHELVEYVNDLPSSFKINGTTRKKILKDSYRKELPASIFDRPKHGFEVPLLPWFTGPLRAKIENEFLNLDEIEADGIFNRGGVSHLLNQLFSKSPNEATGSIWALIAFQNWWKKL